MKATNVNLEAKVQSILAFSEERGFVVVSRTPINYGIQLKIASDSARVSVNVYQGKKGISVVVGGAESGLKRTIGAFASAKKPLREAAGEVFSQPVKVWSGSDEAGKGDYFGPLAVAAVSVDAASAQILSEIGVRDCKKLTDERVTVLAGRIRALPEVQYAEVTLFPKDYNSVYAQLSQQGYNLNDLLAKLHAQAVVALFQKMPRIEKHIVDRFTTDVVLKKWFRLPENVIIVNVPKAESDIAVAAASVLARDSFLQGLEQLSAELSLDLPKGAGGHVTSYAAKVVQKYGTDVLQCCAKMHFRNSLEISGIGS